MSVNKESFSAVAHCYTYKFTKLLITQNTWYIHTLWFQDVSGVDVKSHVDRRIAGYWVSITPSCTSKYHYWFRPATTFLHQWPCMLWTRQWSQAPSCFLWLASCIDWFQVSNMQSTGCSTAEQCRLVVFAFINFNHEIFCQFMWLLKGILPYGIRKQFLFQ